MECPSEAFRESILSVGPSLQQEEIIIGPASDWSSVMVPYVPICIRTLDGRIRVTRRIVEIEPHEVCGAMPIQVRTNNTKLGHYSTIRIAHLKQLPANPRFRLFEECESAKPLSRKCPIEKCQRCWGYHSTRNYVKGQRCVKYSSTH